MPSKPKLFRPRGASAPGRAAEEAKPQQRTSARERGYSPAWDRTARAHKFAHPLCLGCAAINRVAATQATDHVIPPKGDMVLFWDADNWQPACGWHHDVVKQRLELAYGRGDIDASALRLDSPQAVALSLELIEAGEGPR